MESERSYSSETSSSSESSSGSSEGDEELMETIKVLGQTLELPQELCEDYSVFKEFFSMKTWEALGDDNRELLKKFLPNFTDNDEKEKEKTINMLFNHEPMRFTSPLGDFYNNLRHGNYTPDIAKMRKFLQKARAKQQKHKMKSYYAKLLPDILISRERLLAVAKAGPPGPIPYIPVMPPKPSVKNNYKPVHVRVKQRYFEELAAIRSEVGGEESDDENYPEGPPENHRKRRQNITLTQAQDGSISGTLGGMESARPPSLEGLKNVLLAHRTRRQYNEPHPELNTQGITLEDIKQRVALVNGTKKLMFGGSKNDAATQKLKRGPKKESVQKQGKASEGKGVKRKEEPDSIENKPLLPNIKIKCEQEESDSESSSFVDQVTSPKQSKKLFDQVEIKQEVDLKYHSNPSFNYNEPNLESVIKQEPIDPSIPVQNTPKIIQPIPIKLEDLDGIDMMALPVELADDSGEVVQVDTSTEALEESTVDPDDSLTETTHANFLSLVRALFPARAAHRASKQQLYARCAAVMRSPIAPLNTWYSLCGDWCAELDSALEFLAGERGPHPDDYVPYLQFMPETQMYQWIGAGRDCDAILGRLCERWLRAASPAPAPTDPPPPRYPTSWVVRPATSAEIAEFRAQERKRFASAAKPFTYVQHGYCAVAGPCARACGAGAGGAGVVVSERPRHATLLALVRDAVARLPNGEGTRHDILVLLKMSQWIAPCTDQALLSAISSALDRLHSAKRDPMVKYDQRSAIWTYLHRHRSEEDWCKGRGRAKPALPAPALPTHALPMDMEVASVEEVVDNGSDSDVDVDDSGSPTAGQNLSSAQLLMQATQAHNASPTLHKSKTKLVAVSPQKSKNIIAKHISSQAKSNLMAQAAKQANLMAQVKALPSQTKQANPVTPAKPNIMAQAAKQASLPQPAKHITLTPQPAKQVSSPKTVNANHSVKQSNVSQPKQPNLMAQSAKQASVIAQLTKQPVAKHANIIQKQINVLKKDAQLPKTNVAKPNPIQVTKQAQLLKQNVSQVQKQEVPKVTTVVKAVPGLVATPQKSPLAKQRPLQKTEVSQPSTPPSLPNIISQTSQATTVIQVQATAAPIQIQNKVTQGTRSLLIRPPSVQTTVTAAISTPPSQINAAQRRGVVRVLSPAAGTSGKSLISPRALMQQGTPASKKRTQDAMPTVTTIAQSILNTTTVVSSVPTAVTSSVSGPRTVQLAGGRTVQLSANQTVHLPGGQAVQLSGHTLQLSSLQLGNVGTHSVRLPSGQTVQLASPQAVQAIRAVSTAPTKTTQRTNSPKQSLQIQSPIQLGQTVQIAGQTVQLAGQSVQLTGHTVKLPSGQSVQVASQSVLPSQSVQLPSGQTVQLASGNVQMAGGQSVLSQVQLAGQTVQLPSGQTVQLSSGQTLQLASGQSVHIANQAQKPAAQVRLQAPIDKSPQPIVAKLLTNAQGQMLSLEGGARTLQVSGVRVLPPAARLTRPLLLTTAKPLHNIILQQSDGSAIRVTSSGGAATSQIVLSTIGAQSITTSTTTTPVLKLQQVNPIQQVKLPQGIKLQQAVNNASVPAAGVRSVLMDGQQLKLVGGRHVLARILRPAHPPPPQ